MDLVEQWQLVVRPWIGARWARSERGANLIEYALLVALIALVCVGAISFLGKQPPVKLSGVASTLNQ